MGESVSRNFIERIIDSDIESGKNDGRVVTRFPPEPNGYLHIGHAKSINLNFGLARQYGGRCHLRFDDTNPVKEDMEYINSIMEDIRWLGFDWGEHLYFASSYFDQLYQWAVDLIQAGKAYVDDSSVEEIRCARGTLTEPGTESPFRNRTIEENLDLFRRMKEGEFPDGSKVLRAKIDMAAPNLNMRDPIMYRILHTEHPKTGRKWCIYPMYDWAHGLEDAIEGITHSVCTLEFEDHRPLYDWFIDQLPGVHHPQQIEFARLNIDCTVMSKRKLLQLVTERFVDGWDDPRMPTVCGLRRRGFTPESIKEFCDKIGVSKVDSTVHFSFLEFCLRTDLNRRAQRRMAVLRPLKLTITNYPEDKTEWMEAENNPEDANAGTRLLPFSRHLYIEQDDFRTEAPNKKYFRLAPGKEIRLKHAYYIRCERFETDNEGNVTEVFCTYDPQSRGGWTEDGRVVKGTAHWVSAAHALKAEVRLYDRLFTAEEPGRQTGNFLDDLNPHSLEVITDAWIEPSLAEAAPEEPFQFLRLGYFVADRKDHSKETPVFNRSVSLKESFTKEVLGGSQTSK